MDDIAARVPADAVARRVTSKGFEYTSVKRITCDHWEICPATKTVPRNICDLTGRKVGRLTVVGLYANRKARWIVRCTCGRYEMRKAKAINNPKNIDDMCQQCAHVRYLKRHDEYKRLGYNLNITRKGGNDNED